MKYLTTITALALIPLAGCCNCHTRKDTDHAAVRDAQNWAQAARPLIVDQINLQQQAKYRDQQNSNLTAQLNRAEEQKIPYAEIYRYPDNWPELSATRKP